MIGGRKGVTEGRAARGEPCWMGVVVLAGE